jgi:hypothetical membrane protein
MFRKVFIVPDYFDELVKFFQQSLHSTPYEFIASAFFTWDSPVFLITSPSILAAAPNEFGASAIFIWDSTVFLITSHTILIAAPNEFGASAIFIWDSLVFLITILAAIFLVLGCSKCYQWLLSF